MLKRITEPLIALITGEWMLWFQPNGGGVVLARAIQVSLEMFLLGIGLESILKPESTWAFSAVELHRGAAAHLTWIGALFGAAYAALYTRFAAQWTYLSGLYNQLMAAENAAPRADLDKSRRARRMAWWLGFIEDAVDLHMATKPTYSSAIASLMGEPEVSRKLVPGSDESSQHLIALKASLEKSLGDAFATLAQPAVGNPSGGSQPTTVAAWLTALRQGTYKLSDVCRFAEWLSSSSSKTAVDEALKALGG